MWHDNNTADYSPLRSGQGIKGVLITEIPTKMKKQERLIQDSPTLWMSSHFKLFWRINSFDRA